MPNDSHHNTTVPMSAVPGFCIRLLTLMVLIAAYVGIGGWVYFREDRNRILQAAEITLWADARATVNAITIWHAPVWQQGRVFAQSDIVRLYVGSQRDIAPKQSPEREESSRQAMGLHLSRLAERLDATRAAIITRSGVVLAQGIGEGGGVSGKPANAQYDQAFMAEALDRDRPLALPGRMGPAGPLLDILFPVYGTTSDAEAKPLAGVMLTFALAPLLEVWASESPVGGIRTVLLDAQAGTPRALTAGGIEPQAWRRSAVLPGKSRMPALPPPGSGTRLPYATTFWRLTEYVIVPEGGEGGTTVQAVAMRVPLMENWVVVKEQPAGPTWAALDALWLNTVLGSLVAGGILFILLFLRWWWLDGRQGRTLHRQLTACQDEMDRNRQILELIAASGSDGICVTDSRGLITYANAACAQHLEQAESDLVGRNLYSLLGGGRAVIHEDLDAKVMGKGTVQEYIEAVRGSASGTTERHTISKRPLRDAAGRVRGIVTLIRHIPKTCVPPVV